MSNGLFVNLLALIAGVCLGGVHGLGVAAVILIVIHVLGALV